MNIWKGGSQSKAGFNWNETNFILCVTYSKELRTGNSRTMLSKWITDEVISQARQKCPKKVTTTNQRTTTSMYEDKVSK